MSDLVLLDKAMKLYERYDNRSDTFEYLQYIASKFKETDFKIAVYLLSALYNGYSESELIEFDNKIIEAVKLIIQNENAGNSFISDIKENSIARQLKIVDLQEQIMYYKRLNKDVETYEYKIIELLDFLQN
ncbi:MAG: hypothetical protein D8H95_17695 [Lachnospiraceae bacterium]|jgi:hypothetical protein|nr:MAG: hypothetical protein D8H95_17695 [Lachnospiraceae bacterium]